MLVYLFDPIGDVLECLLVSAVIDEDYTHGSFVVSLSDSPEAFLTSSIPYLKLHFLIVNVYLFNLEVDPYAK